MDENNNNVEIAEQKPFLSVLVHSFFVIPFLIAVFCVLLFVSMHLLTREKRSALEYLNDIKVGGASKRWQGALELSKFMSNPKLVPADEAFSEQLIKIYNGSKQDDPRVRQYLALAMGRSQDKRYFDALAGSLNLDNDEELSVMIYSLGMLKDKRALEKLYPYLDHANARVRSLAVVAIGNMEDRDSINRLEIKLNDEEANVQWGAAISLTKMGSEAGKDVILKLLDRTYYTNFPEVDVYEQSKLILAAIDASRNLKNAQLSAKIKFLADHDSNMQIKSAAINFNL